MEKHKWLIAKVALLLMGILVVLTVHWPLIVNTWQSHHTMKSHQAKVTEAHSWKDITPRLRMENETLAAKLVVLGQDTSAARSRSGILHFIQIACQDAGLQVDYIRPQWPETLQGYDEWSIQLGLKGTYHKLGRLLYLLETSENLTRVESLIVTTNDMLTKRLDIVLEVVVVQIEVM